MAATGYCWHCYARQPAGICADAVCPRCRQLISAPADTTYVDKLLWSLSHPLVERRIIAAGVLAGRGERRALTPLRQMAHDQDPYLATAAVNALARYPIADTSEVLREIAAHGPAPARYAAGLALDRRTG